MRTELRGSSSLHSLSFLKKRTQSATIALTPSPTGKKESRKGFGVFGGDLAGILIDLPDDEKRLLTPRLPGIRKVANAGSYPIDLIGEPDGIRTHDLLIKSQLLYRLSYGLFQRLRKVCELSWLSIGSRVSLVCSRGRG